MAELFHIKDLDCIRNYNYFFTSPTELKDRNESFCSDIFCAVITVCKSEGDFVEIIWRT